MLNRAKKKKKREFFKCILKMFVKTQTIHSSFKKIIEKRFGTFCILLLRNKLASRSNFFNFFIYMGHKYEETLSK